MHSVQNSCVGCEHEGHSENVNLLKGEQLQWFSHYQKFKNTHSLPPQREKREKEQNSENRRYIFCNCWLPDKVFQKWCAEF